MKAKDLKLLLSDIEDDIEIILAKDAEGNGFGELEGYTTGVYDEIDRTFYGTEDIADEEVNTDGGVEAICLWP